MKTYTSEELKEILKKHLKWLGDEEEGKYANLRGADLRGADLRDAYLRDADLRDANLRGANLINANLRGADLRDADLRGADLRGADLRGADLINANLRGADLRDADLRGADLRDADLRDANLRGANLINANLIGAYGKQFLVHTLSPFTLIHVDNQIQIGCKIRDIDWWLENGKQLAKDHNLGKGQIKKYENIIKFIAKSLKEDNK